MFIFALIGLCLVLLGIAGLEFVYLYYIERMYRERQKHVHAVERKCRQLADKLDAADLRIKEQSEFIASMGLERSAEEESWADVIEDR